MSVVSAFGGVYSALDYAYGTASPVAPPPLQVGIGNSTIGSASITVITPITITQGGSPVSPIAVGSTLTIGNAAGAETVTVTAVGAPSLSGFAPGTGSVSVTAVFANLHGPNEYIASATFGLQEAINVATATGGGEVAIYPAWYRAGGTLAMILAATVPTFSLNSFGAFGATRIVDLENLTMWTYTANSVTVVAAPSAATALTVASLTGVTGTWTAITEHVLFTYVTADGGETLASADYSFTATVSLAIGGTGPAALAGAVGYRVYIGANATTTCYLVPAIAANGTVIQCGPVAAFKIGTNFSVATATVASALIPVQSTAFPAGFVPTAGSALSQPMATVVGPFAVTGVVTAGTAVELGKYQLPSGFLNFVNRTLRITLQGIWTPVSTAVLILSVTVGSVYNGTETTVYTVTTAASSGTTAADFQTVLILRTALVGATGTIEAHGFSVAGLVTATANLGAVSLDTTQAASSAVSLTGQDYIRFLINSSAANITQSQLRTAIIEVLQ